MIKVGECYYHNGVQHVVIAASRKDGIVLVLSITSGDFDKSCEIEPEEIIDNTGRKILKHRSYICYKKAFEFKNYKTYEKFRDIYDYRCDISAELLIKIKEGAKKSEFLPSKFKKYFSD